MFISFHLYCTFYLQAHSYVFDLQTRRSVLSYSLYLDSFFFFFLFIQQNGNTKLKCCIVILITERSSFRSIIDKTLETMGIYYHLHFTQCAKKKNRIGKKHELMTQLRQSSTDCFCRTVAFSLLYADREY